MAEPPELLIVALSARALGAAARRAGRRVRAIDLFGDTDLRAHASACRVVPGDVARGFEEAALLEAADALAPADAYQPIGLVYGAGFEDRPALLARLCRGRTLCGNTAETVARTKDPHTFFATLDALGIPHPEISLIAPRDPQGWLAKRIGGSGGAHVVPAAGMATCATDCYYQRRIAGRAIGVSFLAAGTRALLIGCNEQWTVPGATASFRFGGVLQPAAITANVAARLRAVLDPLVREFRLVGLNSLDVLVEHDRFHVIELNPRPGASLDIFDGADPAGLFAHHLRACAGELPAHFQPPAQTTAAAVVYADDALRIAPGTTWPAWVADRPGAGARIARDAPVCTVLAEAATRSEARRLVAARVEAVRSALRNDSTWLAANRDAPMKKRSGSTA